MRWSSASRCSPRSRRKSWLAKSRVRLAASTTVSIVSSRATSERLTPAASRKSKVAATGSGSEMPVELDEQVVEAAVGGEAAHLGQEVAAQRAADAAVGHLDQGFVSMQHLGALGAHALGVDVHLGHIVDDDGDPHPLAVAERMVKERRLAGAEEAGQDGNGQSGRHGFHARVG